MVFWGLFTPQKAHRLPETAVGLSVLGTLEISTTEMLWGAKRPHNTAIRLQPDFHILKLYFDTGSH